MLSSYQLDYMSSYIDHYIAICYATIFFITSVIVRIRVWGRICFHQLNAARFSCCYRFDILTSCCTLPHFTMVSNVVRCNLLTLSVFVLCWSPYMIYDLLQVYGYAVIEDRKTATAVATFMQSLAPLNSLANPMIYCLFSTHVCRNIR